ncbi:MAG: MMPL family transporter [Lachnospiraceae bacterium]|nr:MMPL family transporter [Lachnospiraceae bacterium]
MILIISALLLIPSVIGFAKTRVNYDLLSYLPDTLETVEGQNVMVDEYGMGAFSMIVIEGMTMPEMSEIEEEILSIDHIDNVLWYGSLADPGIPADILPHKLKDKLFNGDAALMIAFLDDTTSSDESMGAIKEMREILSERCFISGMTGIVTDIADICMREIPVYVVIAAILSFLILELTTESFLVPFFFLISIGVAILYNLGSNVFLGEISYITQALTAVLQLAVTMDYSIFLLDSYEECKEEQPGDDVKAMGRAIAKTFRSIVSSSVTTVAGFLALCVMTFALGRDIGIVMSKGVIIGVLCCVTFLPSLILVFDKAIQKTKHRMLFRDSEKASTFIIRHYKLWLLLFGLLLFPAIYGNDHTEIYYNIAHSLPEDILSNVANQKLEDTFDMGSIHVVILDRDTTPEKKREILAETEKLDGVQWALGLESLAGPAVPEDFLPDRLKDMLQSDRHELMFVCSEYTPATDEMNAQLKEIEEIVKSRDGTAILIGEAPLMKDLMETTDVDLKRVNYLSIAAIFAIILLTFKSLSVPVILVAVIEFAICVNMAVPYYQGVSLPFVASIVIGTIQLGATVDYAILMTNRYLTERQAGFDKKEAVLAAHKASMISIITSGATFFVATFGVAAYSRVDMIGSICTLLSRGALISMLSVILILPALLLVADPIILKTTWGMRKVK